MGRALPPRPPRRSASLAGVGAYVVGQGLATITRIAGGPSVGRLRDPARASRSAPASPPIGIALEALTSDRRQSARSGSRSRAWGSRVVWPLLLADVNNEARHPALAIGGVTAAGYLGMVAGPPIVGILSGAFDLSTGLLVLAAAALFVAVTPAHVPAADPSRPVDLRLRRRSCSGADRAAPDRRVPLDSADADLGDGCGSGNRSGDSDRMRPTRARSRGDGA